MCTHATRARAHVMYKSHVYYFAGNAMHLTNCLFTITFYNHIFEIIFLRISVCANHHNILITT